MDEELERAAFIEWYLRERNAGNDPSPLDAWLTRAARDRGTQEERSND